MQISILIYQKVWDEIVEPIYRKANCEENIVCDLKFKSVKLSWQFI